LQNSVYAIRQIFARVAISITFRFCLTNQRQLNMKQINCTISVWRSAKSLYWVRFLAGKLVHWAKLAAIAFLGSWLVPACRNEQDKSAFFRYNEQVGIATLDPAFAKNQSIMWAAHQLYNTLVEIDSQLHIVPSLAKSWQVSEDKKTYTFLLRDDVYFHDSEVFPNGKGRKMTAQDVVFSLRRIQDKTTASSGAWIFNDRVDSAKGFVALNDSMIAVHLVRPFNPILGILSMQYCSIIPKEAVERYGKDFRRHAVGTGPFMLTAWEEGQALMMRRNPNYFEKDADGNRLPYLPGIHVSFLDSRATEFLSFQQGKLDFVNDIDPSFKDEVLSKKGALKQHWAGKIVLNKSPYLNIEYIGILVDSSNELVVNSPLRSRAVRQAINHAFDRQKMMLYLRNSIGTAANSGFVPTGLPSFNADLVPGYNYDLAKSRALLQQAGFGKNMPSVTLLTVPIYADLGSFIARELEEVGIKVKVEAIQKSLLLELTSNSKAPLFRGSWVADYPDAENYLSVFYSKNPAPPNYTRYKNPAFDALYEKALQEVNDSARYHLYRQMDQLIVQDAPVIPLWYDMAIHLVQPGILDFKPNALNLLELRRTRKE
jgi:oligopeptide transport system substrate-binding protein